MKSIPVQVPYGAVYFRKSNPPRADWERDYATARDDGMNIFRHWFLWGSIETAPGAFDWADYDAHMDLAAKHGFSVVIAEMSNAIPEWAFRVHAEHLFMTPDGRRVHSQMGGSSVTGGFARGNAGALCLDSGVSRELVGTFLRTLAGRYKDHPALLGYDVWNECFYAPDICFCDRTAARFREWLRAKYGDLDALAKAWKRFSYSEWADVQIPRTLGPYAESLDWLEFRRQNFYEQMQWRIDTIREVDQNSLIAAHGTANSLVNMGPAGSDDWLAASKVQVYGFTWAPSRQGAEFWKAWKAVDLTRSGARGKTFWHAEAQGGPLWLQPQVVGRAPEDGRITAPEDIRLWNLISFAGGARGVLFPRWRPLLDGPLFGAFGPYGMDGSRTERSAMASEMARWANDPRQAKLMESAPVRGQVGIVVVRESQLLSYLLAEQSGYDSYADAVHGAYRGFFDSNVQADFVLVDHIDEYDVLYLPYPIMLSREHADALAAWVERGGHLLSDGCPGYFGDEAHVGEVQPNHGLDRLFGCVERSVAFMPDILDDLHLTVHGARIRGGLYRQSYEPTTGSALGSYDDGSVAAVENVYGHGTATLVGTCPGYGYQTCEEDANRRFFGRSAGRLLARIGRRAAVVATGPVRTRLSRADGSLFLWAFNASESAVTTTCTLAGPVRLRDQLRGGAEARAVGDSALALTIDAKDAVVVELEPVGDEEEWI